MIKVTNIQATRIIGVLLILLSGDAFAVTYATQPALNAEIFSRKSGDSTETIRATKAERTLKAADTAETARAKVAEGTLNKAIAAETARAKVAEAAGAGTTIADGAHKGDILEWDGFAWTPVAAEPVYILGDIRPNGGVVYYVDGSGHHGLAAQPNDEAGVMNWTDAMVAAQAHNNPACPTDILRTPTCWHLPSKNELSWLYEQKSVVGGFASNYYWSSSEATSGNAWYQGFSNGLQYASGGKNGALRVRAVMAF